MDELQRALARAAGLHKALEDHPEDVAAAAALAAPQLRAFTAPTAPTVEPWPPMRAGVRP